MLGLYAGRAGSLFARVRSLSVAVPSAPRAHARTLTVRSGAFDEDDLFAPAGGGGGGGGGGDAPARRDERFGGGERRADGRRRGDPRDARPAPRRGGGDGRVAAGACYVCGEKGHFARDCPSKDGAARSAPMERARVFVSKLDERTRWFELKDHFRDAGFDVVYASVSTDRYTGESKRCGIVQLSDAAEAERAIAALDGSELDGAAVFVREDRQERDRRTSSSPRRDASHLASSDPAHKDGGAPRGGGPWTDENGGPIPRADVLSLLDKRDAARARRDFTEADALRDALLRDYGVARLDDRNRVVEAADDFDDLVANMDDAAVAALVADADAVEGGEPAAAVGAAGTSAAAVARALGAIDDAEPDEGEIAVRRAALEAERVVDLKDQCRALKIKVSGTKAELIERLLASPN